VIFTNLEHYFDVKEAFLDDYIDSGSDHDLFVASYIHGHFSVEAARAITQRDGKLSEQIAMFEAHLQQSIENAIINKELNSNDANDVRLMLVELLKDSSPQ